MPAPLVGLLGAKRAGKDTFAKVLADEHGFVRVAFADPLKRAALLADPIVVGGGRLRLSELVAAAGWEGAKSRPEVRGFLQRLGVAVRTLDRDFWLRMGLELAEELRDGGEPVVVTDVRFENEAAGIEAAGGILVRIRRPDVETVDEHESEQLWRTRAVDVDVRNVGAVADLSEPAAFVAKYATQPRRWRDRAESA